MDQAEKLTLKRKEIDAIDSEIIQLLEKRMAVVEEIAKIKMVGDQQVLDASREQAVLDRVAETVSNPQYLATIQATFEDIMKQSRKYQGQKMRGENHE